MSAPNDPPPGVALHYSRQYRRCGKKECAVCRPGAPGHGPYWFASWRENGRKRSRYLGRHLPPDAPVPFLAEETAPAMAGMRATPISMHDAAPALRVCTLGGFAVWRYGELIPPERWRSRRASALFKLLLAAPRYQLSRDAAIEALWPETDPDAGAHNLRTTLYLLRGILDPSGAASSFVQTSSTSLWLAPDPSGEPPRESHWLDAADFASAATLALAGRDMAACRAALARYTGPYLPQDGAEEWAVRRRDELQGQYLAVLRHLALLSHEDGASEEAERALQTVLQTDACDEAAARQLMRLQSDGGRPLQAIRTYRRLARVLRDDLDLEPDTETQALYTALLAAQPDTRSTSPAGETPPTNLPAPLTSFIGRRQEVAALRTLLASADEAADAEYGRDAAPDRQRGRLLTLTGPGGCGKTRLALQAADEVLEFYPDGVWWVELAGLTDPHLTAEAVATTLGLRRPGGAGLERPLFALLCDLLRPQRLLLVLDNCEHLAGACAELAATLLGACPRLRIVATSREPLRAPGERLWPVPPLSLPDTATVPAIGHLPRYEAVRLFLERARAQRPGFELTEQSAAAVARICQRLDGLPLAIELAAARVRALPVEAIAARLDDRFRLLTSSTRTALPRHRTLRAALDWSYDLLGNAEKALLQRLSVFSGGWTLEAAETVCADADEDAEEAPGDGVAGAPLIARASVLDLLGALVDKSLVEVHTDDASGAMRHRLLETVRQYARERLDDTGEVAVWRQRHLCWYVALAEEAGVALTGPDQPAWLARLATEVDNVRAALHWAGESGEAGAGLRMAGSLWRFWVTRGDLREGRGWLESLLARADGAAASEPATERRAIRARALNGAGALAYYQCDYAAAAAFYTESLALLRGLGDTRGIASALNNLGLIHKDEGDYDGAMRLYTESLELYRSINDRRGCAMALNNLGIASGDRGDAARAAAYHEESLSLKRALGDKWGMVTSLNNLGVIVVDQGDYARARVLHEEGLALARELGNKWSEHVALSSLGRLAAAEGRAEEALACYQDSLALCRLVGNDLFSAITLEGIAALLRVHGAATAATRLCAAAAALCEETGAALPASDQRLHDTTVAAARAELGAAFAAAWTAGRLLGRERVIAEALALTLSPTSAATPNSA